MRGKQGLSLLLLACLASCEGMRKSSSDPANQQAWLMLGQQMQQQAQWNEQQSAMRNAQHQTIFLEHARLLGESARPRPTPQVNVHQSGSVNLYHYRR